MRLATKLLFWSGLVKAAVGQGWYELAPIPGVGSLQEHTTVVLSETELAVVGGLVEGGATTNKVLLYDIATDTWDEDAMAPVPVAMNHPNVASFNGSIYVLGGLGADRGWPAVPDSFVYDGGAWTRLAPMLPGPTTRGSAVVGVYGSCIYLAGGLPGGATTNVVNAYDVETDAWLDLPVAARTLPEPRDHAGGAVVGSRFYVVGGRDSGIGNVKGTVFVLDLEDLEAGWTTRGAKMPTARGGVSAAAVGSKIYTFGGEGNPEVGTSGVFYQVEVYDTEKDEWESLEEMVTPRHGTSAAAVGGKIYVPGGGIVQGVGATNWFDVFVP